MKLKDILKQKGSKVWALREDQTVRHAIEILVSQKIGAVLVLDQHNHIAGILSERDIVRGCYTSTGDLEASSVAQLMTRRVISASPEEEVESVMALMTEHRIRHVPVVSEGKLEGIVSIGDVVKALLQESAYEVQSLKEFIYGPAAS
ncbi:MAG: CBS domain-containing protein [Candidatus Omnitrophica bacterium]|nr:CBS domain-containing protein [Candidatus Omnitrophota bacterium]